MLDMGVLLRRLSIYSNGPYLSQARGLGLGLGWVRASGYLLRWIFRFSCCWMRVGIVIPPVLFFILWIMEGSLVHKD